MWMVDNCVTLTSHFVLGILESVMEDHDTTGGTSTIHLQYSHGTVYAQYTHLQNTHAVCDMFSNNFSYIKLYPASGSPVGAGRQLSFSAGALTSG